MKHITLSLYFAFSFIVLAEASDTPANKCDASENKTLKANVAFPQADGSVIFENPGCKVMKKYIPLVMSLTGIPPQVVSDGYYCNLKGYERATGSNYVVDMTTMVDLNNDGTIGSVQVMNSVYFTAIGCVDIIK